MLSLFVVVLRQLTLVRVLQLLRDRIQYCVDDLDRERRLEVFEEILWLFFLFLRRLAAEADVVSHRLVNPRVANQCKRQNDLLDEVRNSLSFVTQDAQIVLYILLDFVRQSNVESGGDTDRVGNNKRCIADKKCDDDDVVHFDDGGPHILSYAVFLESKVCAATSGDSNEELQGSGNNEKQLPLVVVPVDVLLK